MLNVDQKEIVAIVTGEIPVSETFDLSESMRGATAGKAIWTTHFKLWSAVPNSMQKDIVAQIRKRKGLPEVPPGIGEFIDKEQLKKKKPLTS